MSVTVKIPQPLDEELGEQARREGLSTADHATLLLYLANSLVREGTPSLFKEAVRVFFSYHHLYADHVSAVFERLLAFCVQLETAQVSNSVQDALAASFGAIDLALLRGWRNYGVHRGLELDSDALRSLQQKANELVSTAGRAPQR